MLHIPIDLISRIIYLYVVNNKESKTILIFNIQQVLGFKGQCDT